ncbi:hypothetical protein EC912_102603 [Luteibacter rhizovicinus]|uniref:Uncharacterized protein n=1 Tax=Luteibacter rhizovicinus TaxID=242606 RepID=A0A4R3YY35_9GAMM|nr:hypothetical protein [Luteibacter rhizovicinus]TCV96253.1 hypothetical protein EC912_102603 [Luteibacter rhizovicinus]
MKIVESMMMGLIAMSMAGAVGAKSNGTVEPMAVAIDVERSGSTARDCPFRIRDGQASGTLSDREEREAFRWTTSCTGFVNVRISGSSMHFRFQRLTNGGWTTIADSGSTGTNTYLPSVDGGTYRILAYNAWTRTGEYVVVYNYGIG